MPKALSLDLRQRVVAACEAGEGTQEEIADRFGVGTSTIERWLKRWRSERTLEPVRSRRGPKPKIDTAAQSVLRALLEEQPDARLKDLCARMRERAGISVGIANMSRSVARLGFTKKKRFMPPNVIAPRSAPNVRCSARSWSRFAATTCCSWMSAE